MTNEEWLKSLESKELCKFIAAPSPCDYCAYRNNRKRCMHVVCCEDGVSEWLKQEHKEMVAIERYFKGNVEEGII